MNEIFVAQEMFVLKFEQFAMGPFFSRILSRYRVNTCYLATSH